MTNVQIVHIWCLVELREPSYDCYSLFFTYIGGGSVWMAVSSESVTVDWFALSMKENWFELFVPESLISSSVGLLSFSNSPSLTSFSSSLSKWSNLRFCHLYKSYLLQEQGFRTWQFALFHPLILLRQLNSWSQDGQSLLPQTQQEHIPRVQSSTWNKRS